jgi:hypothetical protein
VRRRRGHPLRTVVIDIPFSFTELFGGGQAQDRVRGQVIPQPGPTLDYLGKPSLASSIW